MKVTFEGTIDEVLDQVTLFALSSTRITQEAVRDGKTEEAPGPSSDARRGPRRSEPAQEPEADGSSDETGVGGGSDDQSTRRGRSSASRAGRSSDASEDKPVSKRGKKKAAEPVEEVVAEDQDDGFTDEDLTKAASEAADAITPAKVKEILDQFGVGFVGELDGDSRAEFIDLLDTAVKEAK